MRRSTRKNPPAGGRTDVETTCGGHQPRRVADQNNANSHTTVTVKCVRTVARCPVAGGPRGGGGRVRGKGDTNLMQVEADDND